MRVLAATIGALLISVSHPALAQEQNGEQDEAVLPAMTAEQLLAQLPERRLTTTAEEPPAAATAEQILAMLPERPAAAEPPPAATAGQILAMLPERPAVAEPPPAATAGQILAMLPERAAAAEPPSAATAGQILAMLPERPAAAEPPSAATAGQILAMLPERPAAAEPPSAATAGQVLAMLPERPAAAKPPPVTTARQVLAMLPERRLVPRLEVAEPPPPMTSERLLARLPERVLTADDAPAPQTDGPRRQPEALKADMQADQMTVADMPADPRWASLKEPNLGTTLDLPRAVFVKTDGHAHMRVGRRYRTADGRARVAVWTQRNTHRDTPSGYLRRTFSIPLVTLDYDHATPDFAVVSGTYRGRVFYLRCNLSRRGNFHCFDLAYPARERKVWDRVIARMSLSLRPADD